MELIQMGQITEGTNLLKRAIDITHKIALELIKQCQSENIDCIIAPYEADAQLAYLNISGIADVVLIQERCGIAGEPSYRAQNSRIKGLLRRTNR